MDADSYTEYGYRGAQELADAQKRIKELEDELDKVSLHGLEPGTTEYAETERVLIKRICDVELEDDMLDKHIRGYN